MTAHSVLVVDDEPDIRQVVSDILQDEGYEVTVAANAAEARTRYIRDAPDLVLLDIWMPDTDGIALLREWRADQTQTHPPVVMISGHGTVETAVEAIRMGAYDFLEKPLSTAKLLITVERALETVALQAENLTLKTQLSPASGFVGHSEALEDLRNLINRIAATDQTVMIRGEAGCGKGVAARSLHQASGSAAGPLVEVNLGALPSESVALELFGAEKDGSVTPGQLEQASGGTLVLDEVGDLDMETQAKLLGALEAGRFFRVGGTTPLEPAFRIVATSNQDLEQQLADKRFREDLFYRLSAVTVQVPPLRAHREDIPDLIQHYVQLITDSQHLPFRRFSTSSVNYLRNRPWPGNVRELINFVHRMLLTTTSEVIEAEETREVMGQSATPLDAVEEKNAWRDFGQPLRTAREHFERDYLEFHLLQTRGNISELARRAELERTHLYRKLKGLGLNPKDEKYRQ